MWVVTDEGVAMEAIWLIAAILFLGWLVVKWFQVRDRDARYSDKPRIPERNHNNDLD